MEFKKLNAPSLRELFVNELQNMILSGKLEIGSKLPPERELAESMKKGILAYLGIEEESRGSEEAGNVDGSGKGDKNEKIVTSR